MSLHDFALVMAGAIGGSFIASGMWGLLIRREFGQRDAKTDTEFDQAMRDIDRGAR